MTNQEVSEYMNRFLDDDLSESEAQTLLAHLRESPASAAMFDRLRGLHDDLVQLPKVSPPISIVDSILPQLEREGLWSATPISSDVMTNVAAIESAPPSRRERKERTRLNFKWIGGTVAAGIVLTLFILTIDPNSNNNFESANISSADSSQFSSSAGSTSATMDSDEQAPITSNNDKATELMESFTIQDNSSTSESDVMSITSDDQAARSGEVEGTTSSELALGESAPADDAVQEEAPIFGITGIPEEGTDSPGEAAGGSEDAGASDDGTIGSQVAEPVIVLSPDEKTVAIIHDVGNGQHQAVITDVNGNSVYQSAKYTGEFINVRWNADSTELTFNVASEAVTRQITIDLTIMSEKAAE